jgi:hypothetical protein
MLIGKPTMREIQNALYIYSRIGFNPENSGLLVEQLSYIRGEAENGNRIFMLSDKKSLKYTTTIEQLSISQGNNIFGYNAGTMSSRHCTDGTDLYVYNKISIADIETLKNVINAEEIMDILDNKYESYVTCGKPISFSKSNLPTET